MTKHGGKREGAGRPRSLSGKESVNLSVILGDDTYQKITKAAEDNQITKGEVVRRVISDWLTERKQPVILPPSSGGRRGKKNNA